MRASCLAFCKPRLRGISVEEKHLRCEDAGGKRPATAGGCGGAALATPPHTLFQQPARADQSMKSKNDQERAQNTRNIPRFFVEHPQVSWVLLVGVLAWGWFGYRSMPQ